MRDLTTKFIYSDSFLLETTTKSLEDSMLTTLRSLADTDLDSLSKSDLLSVLSPYLPRTEVALNQTKTVSPKSDLFKNIFYWVYRGLRDHLKREIKIVGASLVESMFAYEGSFSLTSDISDGDLYRALPTIEDYFKLESEDGNVSVTVRKSEGVYFIWVKKETIPTFTLGDLANAVVADQFLSYEVTSGEIPLIVGTSDYRTPLVIDFADESNLILLGAAGSGKSTALYNILLNLVMMNNPAELSYLILDPKGSPTLNEFSKLPHSLGRFTDVSKFPEILERVRLELEWRKSVCDQLGYENWKQLRKGLSNQPDSLKFFPYLVVVIDELATILYELRSQGNEDFEKVLCSISMMCRSLGIKFICSSQRPINSECPRAVLTNSSAKLLFKVLISDLERSDLLTNNVPLNLAIVHGEALFTSFTYRDMQKIITPSTLDQSYGDVTAHYNFMNVIRMLTFTWHLSKPTLSKFQYLKSISKRKENYFIVRDDIDLQRWFVEDTSSNGLETTLSSLIKPDSFDSDQEEIAICFDEEDNLGIVGLSTSLEDGSKTTEESTSTYREVTSTSKERNDDFDLFLEDDDDVIDLGDDPDIDLLNLSMEEIISDLDD